MYWDRTIQTDHLVVHDCPDIVLWDKHAQRVKIIDIVVPLDKNIQLIYTTNIQKYGQLKHEITEMWRVKLTIVQLIVISATGNVHVTYVSQLKNFDVDTMLVQKTVSLITCRIVRFSLDHQKKRRPTASEPLVRKRCHLLVFKYLKFIIFIVLFLFISFAFLAF